MVLLISDVLLKLARALWSILASVLLVAKLVEKCYFVPIQGFEGVFSIWTPIPLL